MKTSACPACGAPNLQVTRCTSGPHFSRMTCAQCGYTAWGKAPWSLERARAFVLPWGIHRGQTVGELAATAAGREYLRWLASVNDKNPGIAAAVVLSETDGSDGSSLACGNPPRSHMSSRMKKPANRPGSTGFSETTTPFS